MTNKASNEKNEDIDDTCIPKVFIGSSSKAKDIAEIVGKYLNESGKIKAIVWNKVFKITETYIEQLQRILDEYDFAILVITKDNQDEKESKVRQNVLFELGLFMGRLGRHKAIMLCDEDQKVILPSDLEGIHRQTFSSVGDQTSSEYLEKPCSEILEYILDPYEDDISVFKFWKASCNQIRKALKKAPKHAIIKIIQTWLPDIEDFIEELAILLTDKKKQFKFRILLIDYDSNIKDDKEFDLLNARLKCRTGQKRAHAIEKIKDSINQFINLKEDIDKTPSQEPLDLEIHQYNFLPSGPYYQIGEQEMFVGFYLNYCSSINAPMVRILPTAKTAWHRFERHFEKGWENSKKIFPSIIKNKSELSVTPLRTQALDIIEAGISRVLPSSVMKNAVKFNSANKILSIINEDFDVSKGRLFVIGGGKASGLMAQTLEDIIDPHNITAGFVNCKDSNYRTTKIEITAASHPTPDFRGVNGVNQMLALKDKFSINENDLVICLISGGGSALMPCPIDGISLEDKQEMTELLIEKGPSIQEINAVRKHLSKIKGGRLGKFFSPTRVVSLIISDVIGNDLDTIASGPTVEDSTNFQDAVDVLNNYGFLSKAPPRIVEYLEKGRTGHIEETPKKLDNCRNFIIGDIRLTLEAMATKTKELGLNSFIVTDSQKGDPAENAHLRASEILKGKYKNYNVLLIGGETTPILPDNHGKGGRNQHYAAVSMTALRDYPGEWVMASIGTDGSDYMDGISGAIVDINSLNSANTKKITIQSYIDRYDSFSLFEKIGNCLVKTGNIGTNVGDAAVYILK